MLNVGCGNLNFNSGLIYVVVSEQLIRILFYDSIQLEGRFHR